VQVSVTTNAGSVVANLAARAAALRNLRPVLKDIAAEVDRVTAEAFEKSRRVDGLPFSELKDSTKVARLRRRKGLFKKAAAGTKPKKNATAAERKALAAQRRAQVLEAAKGLNFKPLIDTGRMRNSAKARVVSDTTVRWAVVDYGVPHITGTKNARPPQRNPSVFRVLGGSWVIDPKIAAFINAKIIAHVTKPAGSQ
jgi:phage gpG-like protein